MAALALAATALFVALGGTGWAGGLINGAQIKNGTITSAKIAAGQVKNVNLATGAVTATKVLPGSLTASDLAPNTFLPATATAANSSELGGKAASAYVLGNSSVLFNHVAVTYVATSASYSTWESARSTASARGPESRSCRSPLR